MLSRGYKYVTWKRQNPLGKSPYQGRRRVFKSGPAEEPIERRRHERGESTREGRAREGDSRQGGKGVSPEKLLNFQRFYVRFNGFLCVWDQISVTIFLLEKIFLGA